jgi:tRNA(Ile2) C34 agmatinyltransferase TiaS
MSVGDWRVLKPVWNSETLEKGKSVCPFCGKSVSKTAMTRFHNDKCKFKNRETNYDQ